MKETTFVFPARGVGRKDYSLTIEHAVEPVIRSYQGVYSEWQTISVDAGDDTQVDIAIPVANVAIVSDFFVSAPVSTLLGLTVYAVSDAIAGLVIRRTKYGSIAEHLTKGFPFFEIVRFVVHNYSAADLVDNVDIGAVGIYTSEQEYYLRIVTP